MIRKIFSAVAAASVLAVVGGTAQAAGNAKAGLEKSAMCAGCHGEQGFAIAPNFPNLAGQRPGYLVKQIEDFQNNHRYNDTMSPMAQAVASKEDLFDIAAYFAAQKPMKAMDAGSDSKAVKMGEGVYEKGNEKTGLYGCVNCHGPKGRGKSPTNQIFPVIGGQNKDYLVNQLKNFKSGDRKNDPASMMMDVAKRMTDAEIDAVAEYLSTIE